jgi:hypothetical protein
MAMNSAETKVLMDTLMEALEAEVDERKAALTEARLEAAAAVKEATAAEAVGRNDDMDRAAQQISHARWATAQLARTAEATAAALLQESTTRAAEVAALRLELDGVVADAQLAEETLRLELADEAEAAADDMHGALVRLTEDVIGEVAPQLEALAEQLTEMQEVSEMTAGALPDLEEMIAAEAEQRATAVDSLQATVDGERRARGAACAMLAKDLSAVEAEVAAAREAAAAEAAAVRAQVGGVREAVAELEVECVTAELRLTAVLDDTVDQRVQAMDLKVEALGADTDVRLERLAEAVLGEVEPKLAALGEAVRAVEETVLGAMEAAAVDVKVAEEALRAEIYAEVEAAAADTQQALVGLAEDILGEVGPQVEAVQQEVADLAARMDAEAEGAVETAAGLVELVEALEAETEAREQGHAAHETALEELRGAVRSGLDGAAAGLVELGEALEADAVASELRATAVVDATRSQLEAADAATRTQLEVITASTQQQLDQAAEETAGTLTQLVEDILADVNPKLGELGERVSEVQELAEMAAGALPDLEDALTAEAAHRTAAIDEVRARRVAFRGWYTQHARGRGRSTAAVSSVEGMAGGEASGGVD